VGKTCIGTTNLTPRG